MANCMIIPTYWSTPELNSWKVFDHPTSISDEGTLAKTLKNLEETYYPDPVVLFPVPCDSSIEKKVKSIASGFSIDIHIYTEDQLKNDRITLKKNGFPDSLLKDICLDSYGGVRNMGLIYAIINGFENVVMIDDDECIDKDYRRSALRYMGETIAGNDVLGKTGCVVDAEGRKFYDGQSNFLMKNWPKDILFNENVKKELDAAENITPCTVAFGGNMVINTKMFSKVPFDPYGSRGEDDDYVLNARYCGFPFFFDKDLLLLHLPPERTGSFWTRQRQDILRFKYLREKVRLFGFESESLGSFMEFFTQDDLEYKAVSSSIEAAYQFVDKDRTEFDGFLNNAVSALSTPVTELRNRAENFLRFMDAWQNVMSVF